MVGQVKYSTTKIKSPTMFIGDLTSGLLCSNWQNSYSVCTGRIQAQFNGDSLGNNVSHAPG